MKMVKYVLLELGVKMNKIDFHYTWDAIHEYCRCIVEDIIASDKEYDYIYGIPRGGLIPATIYPT